MMRWCNTYGVCKNPNKFDDDVVIDLGIRPEDSMDDLDTKHIAAIRLDKEGVERLIHTLTEYISN